MADRTVAVRLRAVVGEYVAGMARAGASTRELGKEVAKAGKEHPRDLDRVSKAALIMGGGVALGLGLAVKGAMDFDKQMSAVGAAAQGNAKDLANLREAALQAGKDTAFSATEAAEAEEALAKAGVSTSDILGGALTGSLSLAAAGSMNLGQAAEDAASAMTMFQLKGKDVGHIADVLAAGAGKAQGEVSDLTMGLAQSGETAHQMGVSLEDTVGTLAQFASKGLMGSDAGTAFKTMLLALNPQSEEAADIMEKLGLHFYNAQGRFVGVSSVAGQLHDKLSVLSQEEQNVALKTIFGNDAFRAAAILMQDGAEGSKKWASAVNDQGFAADVAAKKTDNLAGDLERLRGSIETALIEGGSAATGALRGIAQHLDSVISGFSELPGPLQKAALGFVGVTGGVLGLLGVIGTVAPKVSAARESLRSLGTVGSTIDKGLGIFGRTLGASIPILGAGVVALDIWARHKADAKQTVEDFTAAVRDDNGEIGENTRKLVANKLESSGALKAAKDLGILLPDVTDAVLGNRDALDRVNSMIDFYTQSIKDSHVPNTTYTDEQLQQIKAAGILESALNKLAPAVRQGSEAAQRKAEAEGDAATSTDGHAQSADHATSALAEEVSAVDALKQSLDALNGKNISVVQAQIAYQASIDDTTQSIKDNGQTTDIGTAKGRANMTALLDQAKAASALAEATVDQTGDQAAANKILQDARTALYNAAVQSGMTKTAAKKLVDQYLQIPKSVATAVNAKTAAAQHAIDEVQRHLGNIRDRTVSINVKTIYTNPGPAAKASSGYQANAAGGYITGPGTSTSDSIPSMLSNGEYVVQASMVDRFGVGFFDALNAGKVPQMAGGGLVRPASYSSHGAGGVATVRLCDEDRALISRALGPQQVQVTGTIRGTTRGLEVMVRNSALQNAGR